MTRVSAVIPTPPRRNSNPPPAVFVRTHHLIQIKQDCFPSQPPRTPPPLPPPSRDNPPPPPFSLQPPQAMPTIMSNRRAEGSRFGGGAGRVRLVETSDYLVGKRMRPLMTANGHGINPVYCIKFDRTGQFIFTGADDGLVKVSFATPYCPGSLKMANP